MSLRETVEDTASDLAARVVTPVAERVRDKADDLVDRLGTGSRDVIDRLGSRIEQLPAAALAKMNLVPTRQARRQSLLYAFIGLLVGITVAGLLTGEGGERRRRVLRQKLGWEDSTSNDVAPS